MRNCNFVVICMVLLLLPAALTGCNASVLPDAGKSVDSSPTDKINISNLTLQQTWEENYPFYQKILALPYNQELRSGKLDDQVFREFIIQDYHFLQNYKKVHGILLSKSPDEAASSFMVDIIRQIDDEIASLHKVYIVKYNVIDRELTDPTAYPSTEFYDDFLVKTAVLEPFEVGLSATLPCHWVYYQVGTDMKQMEKVQSNKYQAWIDEYGTETWENSGTKKVIDFAEIYMKAATDENKLKMKNAFVTAMKLEYMFWDGIYNGVKWVR
jgi:thiaminase/transcriptional activator TenA